MWNRFPLEKKMDKIDEIKQRLSEISLSISRVPTETKKSFISLANAEFSGDYGMALKFIHDQAFEYQTVKALFFNKLESMENKLNKILENKTQNEQKEKPKRLGKREDNE